MWGILGRALGEYFGNNSPLNPCEDQYLAGTRHEPYPEHSGNYDCGKAYSDGWHAADQPHQNWEAPDSLSHDSSSHSDW